VGKHKKIVKELKRPDQFVDFWTRTSHAIVAAVGPRRKPAIAVVVALAVVFVGSAIINAWDAGRRVTASRSLTHIQKMANAELLPAPHEGKDGETKDVDAKDPKDDVPRFKTAGERQAAVLKELDQFLANGAASGLKAEALIMRGATLLDAGRRDDAIASYQAALSSKLDPRLRFLAHEGLGYAYEGKGDLEKARAAFGQLAGDATEFHGFYQDRALYHQARLSEIKGDKAAAVKAYRQILDKAPDTSMKDEIVDRLAVLEAP
jgi:tetratricopeptide (TPR) repeat protein